MLFQGDDPFSYLLAQKTINFNSGKYTQNIRLNLNKLPADFFPKQPPRRINSHSQRLPPNHINEFLACHKTIELQRPRKPASYSRRESKVAAFEVKRQFTREERRRPQKRRMTELKEEILAGFNGTFARKMYSECSQQKKVQLPVLQSARKPRGLHIQTLL